MGMIRMRIFIHAPFAAATNDRTNVMKNETGTNAIAPREYVRTIHAADVAKATTFRMDLRNPPRRNSAK